MTAIAATFSDFKLVKTRGQAQFVFEVPVERADAVLTYLGGLPKSGNEVWIGFARLEKAPETAGVAQQAERPICNRDVAGSIPAVGTTHHERRPLSSLPRSQQAAIACRDPRFVAWAIEGDESGAADEVSGPAALPEVAADHVRRQCGVSSRRELDANAEAGALWDALYARYLTETGQLPEPRG